MIPDRKTRGEETLPQRKVAFYELPGPVVRRFFFYRANREVQGAPLVVSIHGIARNAAAHTYKLIDEAERYGVSIVAPLFEKEPYGQYQQLCDARSGVRSDAALLDILGAAARLSKANVDRVLVFGFSGGAQFTHRFVLAHPERVASAVHVSAGWYTFPDKTKLYPSGLRDTRIPFELDIDAALVVPQHVIVGELDCKRGSALRQTPGIDARQGATRLARALGWVEAMGEAARGVAGGVAPTLQILPGVAHSFSDAVELGCLPRHVLDHFAKDAGLAFV